MLYTVTLLTEVCSQVATEPELQLVSQEEFSLSTANVQVGARLNIVMSGFWACLCRCSCFNPFGPSNAASSLSACYKSIKKSLWTKDSRE